LLSIDEADSYPSPLFSASHQTSADGSGEVEQQAVRIVVVEHRLLADLGEIDVLHGDRLLEI